MASPQLKNGYTSIANEILEQISKLPLSGTQFRIVAVIWRYTYGFNRKSHSFALGFIADAIGTSKPTVSRELKKLYQMNVLSLVKEANFKAPAVIGFNKDYDGWVIQSDNQVLSNPITDTQSDNSYPNGNVTVIQSDNKVLSNPITQQLSNPITKKESIKTNFKEKEKEKNIKKPDKSDTNHKTRVTILSHLNHKCGTNYRAATEKTRKLINARLSDGFTFDDFIEVIDKKVFEWVNCPRMSKYLRPETLFGAKFENYLNQPWTDGRTLSETDKAIMRVIAEENEQCSTNTESNTFLVDGGDFP